MIIIITLSIGLRTIIEYAKTFETNWAACLISIAVVGVFVLLGPIAVYLIDKKYCVHHEMALLKCNMKGLFVSPLTWLMMFYVFQFGVTTVFQIIADAIDASFLVGFSVVLSIFGLILYCPFQKKTMPSFKEVFDTKLNTS